MRGRFAGRGRGRAQGGRNNYQRGARINIDDQRQYRPRIPAGQISGLLTLHYSEGRSNAHEMERFLENIQKSQG